MNNLPRQAAVSVTFLIASEYGKASHLPKEVLKEKKYKKAC